MRFKNFLITEGRSVPMDIRKASSVIRSNCMESYNKWLHKSNALWRGNISARSDFAIVKPSEHTRASANTSNYYTLLTDNLPEWKKYPNRSQSIICANNDRSIYGSPMSQFLVLPFDGSNIGICPTEDFWDSFSETFRTSIDYFNDRLENVHYALTGRTMRFDSNYRKLTKTIEDMEKIWSKLSEEEKEYIVGKHASILTIALEKNLTIKETIKYILDPEKNNFKVIKTSDKIPQDKNRECWTDGDCILVSINITMVQSEIENLNYHVTEKV